MRMYLQLLCSGIALVLTGCTKDSQELEDPVLAEVGDSRITASQLLDFEQRLPKELKTKKSGLDGYRDYLQTIIDKEIYLQEAVKKGLDTIPEVAQKLRKEKEDYMLRLLFKQEFVDKVSVEEQELKDLYEAVEKENEVKLRLIIVETQAEAEEILQRIAAGEDFSQLAISRSLHTSTAPQGGELDGYFTPNRIPVYLQKYITPLEVGQYSEPIHLPNKQYGIYHVMDSRIVSFAAMRNALSAKLSEEKTAVLVEAYLQKLRTDINLQANGETLRQLQQWVEAGRREFSAAERDEVLYEFSGGRIAVDDFWIHAEELDMGFSGDVPEAVRWFAEDVLLPRTLFLQVAYEKEIDRGEQIVQWYQRRKDGLLLTKLRQTAVKDQIEISPEVIRQFYDQRPELFIPPEEVTLQEIMVKTQEEAAALKGRVEAGEELGALADEYTLRTMGKGAQGTFHIHAFEQAFHKELIDATRRAKIGPVYGPVAVTALAAQVTDPNTMQPGGEYYSIFRVLESNFSQDPEPFEKVEKRAAAMLRRAEESRLGNQFLLQLRRDFQPHVVVYEENLKALSPQ